MLTKLARSPEGAAKLFRMTLEVDLSNVPVMETDRHISLKRQAALTRELFKQLGLKGISVRAPDHANASSVYVVFPPGNKEAYEKVKAILNVAFPNHDNRSDYASDYFDFCWSVFCQ